MEEDSEEQWLFEVEQQREEVTMMHEQFFDRAKASLDAEPTRENLDRWMDAAAEDFYGDHARMHSVLRLIFSRCVWSRGVLGFASQ